MQATRSNLFSRITKWNTFSYRFLFNPCYRRSETALVHAARTARRWIRLLAPTWRRKLPQLFPEVPASRGSAIANHHEVNSRVYSSVLPAAARELIRHTLAFPLKSCNFCKQFFIPRTIWNNLKVSFQVCKLRESPCV